MLLIRVQACRAMVLISIMGVGGVITRGERGSLMYVMYVLSVFKTRADASGRILT